jgi:perosamine synthetase
MLTKTPRKIPWSLPKLDREEKEAAIRVINSGWVTQGRETAALEQELEAYFKVKHAVVVNNGTSALIAALLAHGIGTGDEVLVPSFTFIASINAIIAVGATPVLVDSDYGTWGTTPELMEDKIKATTKAIMPVDVAGLPIDIDGFERLAAKHGLCLVHDGATLPGAMYKGKLAGSHNHTMATSFHLCKLVTTVEGGAVFTNDHQIASRVRQIRNHGMSAPYDVERNIHYDYVAFGLNFRITDIQSAIGRVQLRGLEAAAKVRNEIARAYILGMPQFQFQKVPDYVTRHSYMLFGMLVDPARRQTLIRAMVSRGIDIRVCWLPAHLQPYHRTLFAGCDLPNAVLLSQEMLCPPIGNGMTLEHAEYVVATVNEIWTKIA